MTGRPQVSHPRGSTAPLPTLSHCPPRAARSVAARVPPCDCSRLPGPAPQRRSGSRPGARSLPPEGLCAPVSPLEGARRRLAELDTQESLSGRVCGEP